MRSFIQISMKFVRQGKINSILDCTVVVRDWSTTEQLRELLPTEYRLLFS